MSLKSRATPASPFKRYNSSPEAIRFVVMIYVHCPLSLRNIEDLLFECGIDISHDTVRFWWSRLGPIFAADIGCQRMSRMTGFRHGRWHLGEMFVKINGATHYLWRAVDHEGEIVESCVNKKRDQKAVLRFFKKTLKRHGKAERIVIDGLKSYISAIGELGIVDRREMGRWKNNRAENSLLPVRRQERVMQRFRRMKSLQKFASVHANVHNHFSSGRDLTDRHTYKTTRSAALAKWQNLMT